MAQLLRRRAVEQPVAVVAPGERAAAAELAERRRHLPPALGEMPEREQQAVVDALVVRDRERDGEVVRAAGAAVEELDAERRPREDPLDEPVVEHGERRRLEHRPAHLGLDVRALRVPRPRPQHVAMAEQLDAAPPHDVDLARHQPLDDQEAAVVRVALERGLGVPDAGGQPRDARERLAPRALVVPLTEQLPELGIRIDDRDGPVAHPAFLPDPRIPLHVRAHTSPPRRCPWSNPEARPTFVLERDRTTGRRGRHVGPHRPHDPPRERRDAVTAVHSPRLETRATTVGGANAIAVAGELDMETAPQLGEEVEPAVWDSVGAFVLDLSGVTFIDSSGLHALLRARAYLAREDRALVLVCPPGPARKVLDLASVLDTFVVYSSPDSAAAALVPADG